MNWTVIISLATLMAAIVSPIITTVINNAHESKIKKQEYIDHHAAEVIEKYIHSVGGYIRSRDTSASENYGSYGAEVYLYLPEELWNYVDLISGYIKERNYDDAATTSLNCANRFQHVIHAPRHANTTIMGMMLYKR